MNQTESFRAAMHGAGLDYSGLIVADGEVHRFKAASDHARNSWYVLHAGPPSAGAFGCWKRQFTKTWCEHSSAKLSVAERQALKQAELARKTAERQQHQQAAETALWIWNKSTPANAAHPYLQTKNIKLHGELRQRRGKLVVPLCNADGDLHSLQFIGEDGSKMFLRGGYVKGCLFVIADDGTGPLVICEGVATGESLHEVTGHAVYCAMNCGNLLAVAKILREKFLAREIIIAADNDQWTDGNPGVAKATEAAKAIGARLVVPAFADVSTKPTDFNDLHQLEGLDAVKKQLSETTTPEESDDEVVERLAVLSLFDFDRCVKDEADAMGTTVSTLRSEVERKRKLTGGNAATVQGRSVELPDVEPWPHPVDGATVLNQTAEVCRRYVALPDGAADALALWTAHAHCYEAFLCSPRLNVTSPEKGCGKTTLRDAIALLVPRPLSSENLTTPVLFRVVEKRKPTLLADEYDSWIHENEELRGMLNAGHRRGGQALRCEGDNHEVRAFNVFCPVVLCGIGNLPGTLHDRSIHIRLVRAKPGEITARFDSRRIQTETDICRKLTRWCADNATQIEATDPIMPNGAFNRLADNWRPLFAIAEVADGDWPQRAASAFALLTTQEDANAQGTGTMLLADIRSILSDFAADRIFSKSLVELLVAMSDRPWGEIRKGKEITENWLATRLRSFRVLPKTLRIGTDRAKGYECQDFSEAFERYLPTQGESNRDTVTNPVNIDVNPHSQAVTSVGHVTGHEAHETPENIALSRCHGSKTPALVKRELVEELL